MNPLQTAGMAAVAIAVTGPIMSMFVPNVYDVRVRDRRVHTRGIRHGLIMGAVVVMGVGVVASYGAGNMSPLLGAVIGAALVAGVYEWALRNPVGADA